MSEFLSQLLTEILKTGILEWIGFALSIIYLILATKESIWCWLFAILSSGLYIYLFFEVNLYIDSILQLFYVIMAIVGWKNWGIKSKLKITFWSLKSHLIAIGISSFFSLILAYLFDNYTNQAFPYIDAFIFCFSVMATFLITKKVIENWIYFVIIDFAAIFIYWNRELHLTAVLFVLYTILALVGYFVWLKTFKLNKSSHGYS
ncbi:MAG: nicotinamide riboside transporter PnuC [Bacteroidota bacterium]